MEVSRGAVLTLGFVVGRILHRNKLNDADAASEFALSTDSALSATVRSAVSRLGNN